MGGVDGGVTAVTANPHACNALVTTPLYRVMTIVNVHATRIMAIRQP